MTLHAWPLDATPAGEPGYDGRRLRATTVAPFLAGATAARPLGVRSGVRPGTPETTVAATATTWTVQPCAGVIDPHLAAGAGPYAWAVDSAVSGPLNAASQTHTGSSQCGV